MKTGLNRLMAMQEPLQTKEFQPRAVKDWGYTRKRDRSLFATIAIRNVADRAMQVLWPWSREEYPGRMRLRAWLLGLENLNSARQYSRIKLPKLRVAFLADRLRQKRDEIDAVILELETLLADGKKNALQTKSRKVSISPPE